jgi:SAM-dependent methyltransferase
MVDGTEVAGRSFEELMEEAEEAPFSGWSFSFLRGRTEYEPLPWAYPRVVGDLVGDRPLLDLGTGGGEVLSRLDRPRRTVATEAWAPNVPVAARRLGRLGVPVVQYQPAPGNLAQEAGPVPVPARERLPFRDGAFGLVISRHEAFVASEVARVLGPGGWFVTQQVDLHWDEDFRAALGLPPGVRDAAGAGVAPVSAGTRVPAGGAASGEARSWLPVARRQVTEAGLVVTRARAATVGCTFTDVGALAFYLLRAVPWVVPEAARAESRPAFRQLHEQMQAAPLRVRNPHFLLVARKPAAAGG